MNDSRTLSLSYDPLSQLRARKRADNPKMHAEGALEESLRRNGFITPPIVNDFDGLLLAGHGRIDVLTTLHESGANVPPGVRLEPGGDWLVPTIHGARLDAEDAKAFLIADNRVGELGGWDEGRLAQLLLDLNDGEKGLVGVGYSSEDLDRLVASLLTSIDRRAADPDDVPPAPDAAAVSIRPGSRYRLGAHTLVCADSRTPGLLAALTQPRSVSAMITDPPYGVEYRSKGPTRLTITGDKEDGLAALLADVFASVDDFLSPGAAIYVFHPAGPLSQTFARSVTEQGWTFRQGLVWNKGTPVLGRSKYQYAHEPIIFATKPGRRTRNGAPIRAWFGGRDASSVLDCPRPRASRDHPTMKPVALLESFLKNSTERGDLVLDPFLGSGSLLIAAERLGRRCLGVEVDPRYAEVAIRRWERFTGQTAQLVEQL